MLSGSKNVEPHHQKLRRYFATQTMVQDIDYSEKLILRFATA
jgi:hypothetical protein